MSEFVELVTTVAGFAGWVFAGLFVIAAGLWVFDRKRRNAAAEAEQVPDEERKTA